MWQTNLFALVNRIGQKKIKKKLAAADNHGIPLAVLTTEFFRSRARHPQLLTFFPEKDVFGIWSRALSYGLLLYNSRPIFVKRDDKTTFRIHVERVDALHLYLFLEASCRLIALDFTPRYVGWFQRALVFNLKGFCIMRLRPN